MTAQDKAAAYDHAVWVRDTQALALARWIAESQPRPLAPSALQAFRHADAAANKARAEYLQAVLDAPQEAQE